MKMPVHIINGQKVRTTNEYPPIPIRSMDWSAVFDDTYDAEIADGSWRTSCPIGRGPTEQEAITDLFDQVADAEPSEQPLTHSY